MLTYGPNGMSRGIATIIFSKPGSANDALVQLNGMLVDKRPMKVKLAKPASLVEYLLTSVKIEVVLNASKAAAVPVKGLGDRVTYVKNDNVKNAREYFLIKEQTRQEPAKVRCPKACDQWYSYSWGTCWRARCTSWPQCRTS